MIIYNITIKVELAVANQLKQALKEYGNLLESQQKVQQAKLYNLVSVDSSDGLTYCLQFHFADMSAYNLFKATEDVKFKQAIFTNYKDKMVLFDSILKEE